jgi:DNA helicase-2/ATP-dependent DNA helicase PcrA
MQTLFSVDLPDIDLAVRRNLAKMLDRPAPNEKFTDEMIRKQYVYCAGIDITVLNGSIRLAPPLSMWDSPEPRDKNFNRFARREVTKATRAAEYWASDADDYALPDMKAGFSSASSISSHPRHHQSSRLSKPYAMAAANPSSPTKPVVKIPPRDHKLPAPLPFTFGTVDDKKKDADLGSFTNSSNDSLAAMKSLGLPAPSAPEDPLAGLGMGFKGGSDWKSLAQPTVTAGGSSLTSGIQLAKGTKRLGMGRPAPWGSKK